MFNVVKAEMQINQSAFIYKWIWMILTASVVHSCFDVWKVSPSVREISAVDWRQQDRYADKSAASDWRSTASELSDFRQTSTVFTFIKSHANDSRLLQNNHTHLYTHQTGRLYSAVCVGDVGLQRLISPVCHSLLSNFLFSKSCG